MDELTVDRICMKKSYSKKITFNSKTQSIVEGLIQIAKKLNIEIVFDAVEKDETVSVLRQMDVPLASGPLYGQPLSYKELRKLMDDQYIKGGDGQ
jgi:sensor c-di-GMP phosphodiesterase-like protein